MHAVICHKMCMSQGKCKNMEMNHLYGHRKMLPIYRSSHRRMCFALVYIYECVDYFWKHFVVYAFFRNRTVTLQTFEHNTLYFSAHDKKAQFFQKLFILKE